jgi:hypothetical protein
VHGFAMTGVVKGAALDQALVSGARALAPSSNMGRMVALKD